LLHLCDPCKTSKDCQGLGSGDAACVAQGHSGSFCGVACKANGDCPTGYACSTITTSEGATAQQCVRLPEAGDTAPGACPCSSLASATLLATACAEEHVDDSGKTFTCSGQRMCGPDGLSACSAPVPTEEVCDGADNDCDGQVDEDACNDKNACTVDTCGGKAGCSHTPLDAVPCDADGSVCTQGDACVQGQCIPGKTKPCDDGNACTVDACDPASGCTHTSDEGAPCDDQNPCTVGDQCKDSACAKGATLPCESGEVCVIGKCSLVSGKCQYNNALDGIACDDGSACTESDACGGGICQGKQTSCDDGNPCTTDGCTPAGGCSHVANTAACDDGNPCTVGDACQAKACVPGGLKSCDDGLYCTLDNCNAKTGACMFEGAQMEGAGCDADGSVCTQGDTCKGGVCAAGVALGCDDGNPCTTDGCDPKTGCTKASNVAPCDDGNACTQKDTCNFGDCQGIPSACTDGNPCTDDACSAIKGCVSTANTAVCDDGSACTSGDVCAGGACAGKAIACDDGNPCTTETCDKLKGCQSAANSNACDDGNACTASDTCTGGGCVGKTVTCNDGNLCTQDSCDKVQGCVAKVMADGADCSADGTKWCQSQVCVAKPSCGNGIKEGSEQCDDGNKTDGDGCSAQCTIESSKCVTLGVDVRTLEQGPDKWQLGYCQTLCENTKTTIPAGWHIAKGVEVQFLVGKTKFGSCAAYGLGTVPNTGTSYWYGGGLLSTNSAALQYSCTTGGCWALTTHCYTQVMLIHDGKDGTCSTN
jgi:cysteine-rich repeat protein